ncbi:MAG: M20 family metallopeptidase [Armatimonadetes bacterium]|nr:M20 family metallopeptidase [Armatimonadota bacterium]
MPDVIDVLADLVALPSVNPMGSAREEPEFGEARVADYVIEFMARHGVRAERRPVLPGRDNILAHVPGRSSEGSILLETHMDTVRVDHMRIAPFEPVQREGRLFGRGACDAKASLAAMMVALAEAERARPPVDVWLCAAVDEEYTFGGAAHLVRSGFRASCALVGEPTGLRVVTAHKGAARWRLVAQGRSAHAATPWEGDNAIYRMAKVVSALERHAEALGAAPPHPRLGPRTLSVGTIEGGQTVNTVPDRCTITVDRRVLPGEKLPVVASSMARLLSEEGLGEGIEVNEILRDPPMEIADDAPWPRAVLAAARSVGTSETAAVHYGTDASKFAEAGMPSVVLGPGNIAQAHTAEEWVEVEEVRAATAIYGRLLQDVAAADLRQ